MQRAGGQRVAAALLLAVACALLPATAGAEGLRVGFGGAALRFPCSDPQGAPGELLFSSLSARVARGRAGLTLAVPVALSNADVRSQSDGAVNVGCGGGPLRAGLSDVSVALDYNLVQDRTNLFIVTLGGSARFPTAAAGLGNGEHVLGLSLSAVYGFTPQLLAFVDLRQSWRAIHAPVARSIRTADAGLVYWFTGRLGVTASVSATDYAGSLPFSVETNVGLMFEALPGMMVNAGGIAGLAGAAPQAGGTFGFGFEL
jgi:hypothetical protein